MSAADDYWRGVTVGRRNWTHKLLWVGSVLYRLLVWAGLLAHWCVREAVFHPLAALVAAASGLTTLRYGLIPGSIVFVLASLSRLAWRVREFGRARGAPRRYLWPILFDLSRGAVRSWQIRRRWRRGSAQAVKLVGAESAAPLKLRRWITHSPVRASCVVNLSAAETTVEKLTGDPCDLLRTKLRLWRVNIEEVRGMPWVARLTLYFGSLLGEVQPLTKLPAPEKGWAWFGIDEDEQPSGLHLGFSALFVGESRSGKSNTMWAGVASAIEQTRVGGDVVQWWVIDQAETEFVSMLPLTRAPDDQAHLFRNMDGFRYARTQEQGDELLRLLEAEGKRRATLLRDAGNRKMVQGTEEFPRIVLIIDELLQLIRTQPNERLGRSAKGRLLYVLSQCAKYGITVWGGTQAAKVNVVSDVRDFFQQRVVLSTSSTNMTDSGLGEFASTQGANCHKLSVARDAGRGWMRRDGDGRGFVEFRSVFVPDAAAALIGRGEIPDELLVAHGVPADKDINPGAVYILWSHPDQRGRMTCLYVGRTKEANPMDRWRRHLIGGDRKPWAGDVGEVEVKDCGSERVAITEEARLIRKYNPVHNEIRYLEVAS